MRRVEPQRTQHRQQLMFKVVAYPGFLFRVPFSAPHEADSFTFQQRDQDLIQNAVLLLDLLMGDRADLFQDVLWQQVVGAGLDRAGDHLLLQARDADLEKLVQVGAGDAQKAQPFEQRYRRVLRLLEDTTVELEQAEFPVQEQFRLLQGFRQYD